MVFSRRFRKFRMLFRCKTWRFCPFCACQCPRCLKSLSRSGCNIARLSRLPLGYVGCVFNVTLKVALQTRGENLQRSWTGFCMLLWSRLFDLMKREREQKSAPMGRTRSISHAFQQNRLDPQIQEGLQEFKDVLSVLTSHTFAPAWLDLWLQLFVKPVKILWSTSVTWGWCSYSTSSGGDCAHSSDPDTGSSWPQFPWTTKSNSYFLISVLWNERFWKLSSFFLIHFQQNTA